MIVSDTEPFDSAAAGVCPRIRRILLEFPADIRARAQEIRLRRNLPAAVCCPGTVYFPDERGGASLSVTERTVFASAEDMENTFQILCESSVYSHENEISCGYLTLRGGHRAGLCGTAVLKDGAVAGLRDISSVSLRVSREIIGCADGLLTRCGAGLEGGLLLAGPPGSGKTTLLRDLARRLSGGADGPFHQVCVVDERGEIAASFHGAPQKQIGFCCDVLTGCPKAVGILMAVRSLSPKYILCDELGSREETAAVEQSLNAGAVMIASIHAGSAEELLRREQAVRLLKTGAFENVAVLRGSSQPGKTEGVYRSEELLAEICGGDPADRCRSACGIYGIAEAEYARQKA